MSDSASIVSSIISTLVGGSIGAGATWHAAWHFARQSSAELADVLSILSGDNQKARQALNTLGRILEQAGLAEVTRDTAGNLTGLKVIATAHASATFDMTATADVRRVEPPQYDRQHEQPPAPEQETDHV